MTKTLLYIIGDGEERLLKETHHTVKENDIILTDVGFVQPFCRVLFGINEGWLCQKLDYSEETEIDDPFQKYEWQLATEFVDKVKKRRS